VRLVGEEVIYESEELRRLLRPEVH
jgi:hypothetical protein